VVNDPVNYVDPLGLSASDSKWTNNGDGTYTAKPGATLWRLQQETGVNWQDFGFDRSPETLQVGETITVHAATPNVAVQVQTVTTQNASNIQSALSSLNSINSHSSGSFGNSTTIQTNSISQNTDKKNENSNKGFFSNHTSDLIAVQEGNGAAALYARGGFNLDIKHGNFNLNGTAGFATVTIPIYINGNTTVDVNLQAFTATVLLGMQGNRSGFDADFSICKGSIILTNVSDNTNTKITIEGLIDWGKSFLYGLEGFKEGGANGFGGSVSIEMNEKQGD